MRVHPKWVLRLGHFINIQCRHRLLVGPGRQKDMDGIMVPLQCTPKLHLRRLLVWTAWCIRTLANSLVFQLGKHPRLLNHLTKTTRETETTCFAYKPSWRLLLAREMRQRRTSSTQKLPYGPRTIAKTAWNTLDGSETQFNLNLRISSCRNNTYTTNIRYHA